MPIAAVEVIVAMLACGLGFPVLIGAAVWTAARSRRRPVERGEADALGMLDTRLAAGEIEIEDYYERESALRAGRSVGRS